MTAPTLNDILAEHELTRRPTRPPDFAAENRALVELAAVISRSPAKSLQKLVDTALLLTGADSAGISVLESENGEKVFRWRATAGKFASLVGGTLPRDFSPCGVVLDQNATQFMVSPSNYYPYIKDIKPPVEELLLVPFHQHETPIGTVWVVSHPSGKRFDNEDARILQSLATMASTAVLSLQQIGEVQNAQNDRELMSANMDRQTRAFDTAVASISDFTYIFDREGRFLFANKPLLDLWGLTLDQAVGKDFHDLKYPPELAARLQRQIEWVFNKREILRDETLFVLRTGEEKYFEYIFTPVFANDGAVEAVAGCTRDMTDRKRLELEREQLLSSERAARGEAERAGRIKDEFLATLSHELRTPLSAILGWSHILRSDPADPQKVTQGLETIERNARAQNQIIEDLLDMSRIISGKVRLDVQKLDLSAVVQAAANTVRPTADAKGIQLHTTPTTAPIEISGDPNRLQQVLWNLLSNAIKFTPRDGHVRIQLQRDGSTVRLRVIDTGEGIKPEFLPYVFDRFRQADASTTRQHGGLGLGLAIVKQLIELHGGTIHCDSAGKGHGCTFTVELPIATTQPSADDQPARKALHRTPEWLTDGACHEIAGVRVLVVDDEPDARALVKRFLEDCDAEVYTAGCVNDAIKRLRCDLPQVLVSDIGMPGEDGFSLIRQIRALPPHLGGSIPAIALTAYARSEDRNNALMAGFQMHASKPVEPLELIAMVASLSGRQTNGHKPERTRPE